MQYRVSPGDGDSTIQNLHSHAPNECAAGESPEINLDECCSCCRYTKSVINSVDEMQSSEPSPAVAESRQDVRVTPTRSRQNREISTEKSPRLRSAVKRVTIKLASPSVAEFEALSPIQRRDSRTAVVRNCSRRRFRLTCDLFVGELCERKED